MHKQIKTKNGVVTGRGIEWTEFTWNPIAGCFHGCRWKMPNGEIAICYAEDTAESGPVAVAYPEGFQHHYWHPNRLSEPKPNQKPAKIFVGSMADVFGHWVSAEQIQQVLDVAKNCPQHSFQFLTKNAPRLETFHFPANAWVGASSPPDYMNGARLSDNMKHNMLTRTLKALSRTDAQVKWISFEPLSWDVSEIVKRFPGAIQWAVIGAASNGKTYYPPNRKHLDNLLAVLKEQNVPVFFKGNLSSLVSKDEWREEFPVTFENLIDTREVPELPDELFDLSTEDLGEFEMTADGLGGEGDNPNV